MPPFFESIIYAPAFSIIRTIVCARAKISSYAHRVGYRHPHPLLSRQSPFAPLFYRAVYSVETMAGRILHARTPSLSRPPRMVPEEELAYHDTRRIEEIRGHRFIVGCGRTTKRGGTHRGDPFGCVPEAYRMGANEKFCSRTQARTEE